MIDGKTKLTGIIGWPVEHSLSPAFHNAAYEVSGLNWVYVPLAVAPNSLAAAVEGLRVLNFTGFNVTMPHKKEIIPYLDELSGPAEMAGAVNTVKIEDGRLIGYNTDGEGFISSLRVDAGFSPEGKSVILLGAGGAGTSLAVSLAAAGAARLAIVNRSVEKGNRLKSLLEGTFTGCTIKVFAPDDEEILTLQSESQLIVNATSVGMANNPGQPIRIDRIGRGQLVFDAIYDPVETEFLAAAKKYDAKTLNGINMLLYQGAASWRIWTGLPAPVAEMAAALKSEINLKGIP